MWSAKFWLSAGLVPLLAAAGVLILFAVTPLTIREADRTITVAPGTSLKKVARELRDKGVLPETLRLVWLGRLSGHASGIKAGIYELPEKITPLRLLEKFTRGEFSQAEITFIEGWTFRQMREVLNQHPRVWHDTAELSDRQLLDRIGVRDEHPEGLFFPDTYHFAKGASDTQILQTAHRTMAAILAESWSKRSECLPFETPYQALIMASIVEKETGRREDRPMIAAVFVNRLRKHMLLQTDPTVIYGLGARFDGNLRRVHLDTDGPYNTYTRAGLPPTPIAAAGRESIEATLHPAASSALYFVSRGDGTSAFSDSLNEHNRAVQRYQPRR
ncbi:MAG: endolytic transglycosylase MltG [Betaproteobacteria bacterium]|nr:endolytic transglycosylase MltG [Betaproteobacteria bacterium]